MNKIQPGTEERTQAEAIVEAFENNDLSGSLTDEVALCLGDFRRLGAAAERERHRAVVEAASNLCCYDYNADGHFNSRWNMDIQALSDALAALDAADKETGE